MAPSKRVDAEGRVVGSAQSQREVSVGDTAPASSSSGGGPGAALRSRIPDSIDVFGFNISPRQLIIVQILATMMLGWNGSVIFLLAICGYALFQRLTSGGGGAGDSGGRGGRGWGGGGSNVRGMRDLPKPPPSGG